MLWLVLLKGAVRFLGFLYFALDRSRARFVRLFFLVLLCFNDEGDNFLSRSHSAYRHIHSRAHNLLPLLIVRRG